MADVTAHPQYLTALLIAAAIELVEYERPVHTSRASRKLAAAVDAYLAEYRITYPDEPTATPPKPAAHPEVPS